MPVLTNRLSDSYGWNERANRYIDLTTGRFVAFLDVRDELEQVIEASGQNIRMITERLQVGEISLSEWQVGMAQEIRVLHAASYASARGGWAQMSQADWGACGALVKKQYQFLQGFADDIASGAQSMDGRLLVRADLYAQAGRGTFEEARRRSERLRHGAIFEIRVLGAADHCNGCLEQAAKRWQPIGTLDPIGAEECSTNCHCHFEFADYESALSLGLIKRGE